MSKACFCGSATQPHKQCGPRTCMAAGKQQARDDCATSTHPHLGRGTEGAQERLACSGFGSLYQVLNSQLLLGQRGARWHSCCCWGSLPAHA
jgi:hypothetical protein